MEGRRTADKFERSKHEHGVLLNAVTWISCAAHKKLRIDEHAINRNTDEFLVKNPRSNGGECSCHRASNGVKQRHSLITEIFADSMIPNRQI